MARTGRPPTGQRGAVNTKIRPELRRKLEDEAARNHRTLSAEIEARLERSIDDPLAKVFKPERERYIANSTAAAKFVGAIAELFKSIDEVARRRGFTEAQTRAALRAALDRLAFFYLWVGEASRPYPEGYVRKSRTHHADMPPGPMGHAMATSLANWNSAYGDEPIPHDTAEGRISNHWSGDGSKIEMSAEWPKEEGPSIEDELISGKSIEDIMAERGLRFASPEELDKMVGTGE